MYNTHNNSSTLEVVLRGTAHLENIYTSKNIMSTIRVHTFIHFRNTTLTDRIRQTYHLIHFLSHLSYLNEILRRNYLVVKVKQDVCRCFV